MKGDAEDEEDGNIMAAGAGSGAIVAAVGQQHLKIPSETLLEFKLQADFKVQ